MTSLPPVQSPAPPRPLPPLARLSATHASLLRAIGRGRSATLPALDASSTLELHLDEDPGQHDWTEAFELQGSFGAVQLLQGPRLLRALSGIDVEHETDDASERWLWLQAALIGRLAGTPLAHTRRLAATPQSRLDDGVTLRLTVRSDSHALLSHARATPDSWQRLLSGAAWQQQRASIAQLPALALALPVVIARHQLPSRAARALAAGDVVLPASPAFDCAGLGRIRVGRLNLTVRYEAPDCLTIIALENTMEAPDRNHATDLPAPAQSAHPATADAAQDAVVLAALDDVPVNLAFQLGALRLSLGQLRALGPGSVLVLDQGTPGALSIVSGDLVLGRGEAVDVDGRLGIRVLDWTATI